LIIILALLGSLLIGASAFLKLGVLFPWSKRSGGVAVEHGNVATPEDFKPRGRLYFVPMGRQAIPAQNLADYYRKKFNIQIEVLPAMTMSEAYNSDREQYAVERLIAHLREAYPQIARDPEAVLIGLTDEDIFQESFPRDSFTYSYHGGYRFGVVSTRRMHPEFWGKRPNADVRDASTRQMLTKYVAFMYLHVPYSRDPTSLMRQPLIPDGGGDDLYEADLHSEESANGLDGNGWPCISHVYSYKTHRLTPLSSIPTDCNLTPPPASPEEEVFRVELGPGRFVVHSMDLSLQSTPPIEYRRAYISGYRQQRALGWSTDVSFNTALTSDGASALTYIDIVRENGSRDHLERASPGRGFSPTVVFDGREIMDDSYGARMTWDGDHFVIKYRDGSSATYLPCGDYQCFLTGYQDAAGYSLKIDRGPNRELLRVSSRDNQGLVFRSDDQRRIVQASDTFGHQILYEYDSMGRLVRVRRGQGRVTVYEYDSNHNMTRVSVVDARGGEPHTLITNEYDPAGHLIGVALSEGSKYTINYQEFSNGHVSRLAVKDESSGRTLYFALTDDDYRAWTSSVRFPERHHRR
jgi:YD repeat-containing protein